MRKDRGGYGSVLVLILSLLFFEHAMLSTSLAQEEELIFINKSANASSYEQEDDILYTINYSANATVSDVKVTDILPDSVVVLDFSPPPTHSDGNNLTWVIGDLNAGDNGSIFLLIEHPDLTMVDFKEDSSISGYGFVNTRKKISNLKKSEFNKSESLTNIATISARYENGSLHKAMSSITVDVAPFLDITLKSQEHGSGIYREDQLSSLNNSISSVKLSKDLSVRHEPVSLRLPRQKILQISSLWSDRNDALTDDGTAATSVGDDYSYMESMDKETSYDINKKDIAYSMAGNFSGGVAQFSYSKRRSLGKEPGSQSDDSYISESYHGDFNLTQSMDAYEDSPTYEKIASGTGFVSSQKVPDCGLRSSEQGSGSYQSDESIQGSTILKNISLKYEPAEQEAGHTRINYSSKWGETMYARNKETGSEILNRFSSLDQLQKDAIMSSSYLSMTGRFDGSHYLKARAFSDINYSSEEALKVEQLLMGDYSFDTTIALGGAIKYAYPHINLTKKVLTRNDYIVTYRIWVNNDGSQVLAPVAVVDLLPAGSSFISSSLKPIRQGRIITWTLQTLPPGETIDIDLKVSLPDLSPSTINRVQAASRYQNRTVLAEASASPDDTIEAAAIKEANDTELRLLEETVYGLWETPSCFGLNSSFNCTCERYADEFYNNLTGDCGLLP